MMVVDRSSSPTLTKQYDVRKHTREPVTGYAVLTWDDDTTWGDGSTAMRAMVEVRDISDGGLQLETKEPVAVGSLVCITGDEFRCVGTVRYCNGAPKGFLVGIKFSIEPNLKDTVAQR